MLNLIRSDLYRAMRSPFIYLALIIAFGINMWAALNAQILTRSIINRSSGMGDLDMVWYEQLGYYGKENKDSDEIQYDLNAETTVLGLSDDEMNDPKIANFVADIYAFADSVSSKRAGFARVMMSRNINLYYSFIFIIFAILATDLSGKTVKNTLSSSVSKSKYMLSKHLVILIMSASLIIISNIFAYLISLVMLPDFYVEPIWNILKATLYQLPLLLGIASLMLLLVLLLKKAAIFMAVSLPLLIVLQLLYYLIFNISLWYHYHPIFLIAFILKYEPKIALCWLAYLPPANYVITCALIGICMIVISSALSCFVLKKTEIK